ncbi:hypothetical protein [Spiroplasma sp. AdecLV25b]|uniref:hypothetical protein n=1 Tax=Spiroplasma sp. AdecLV25b TaxID=3027162 RepID=UPI0027DF3079|nr:hypothetical protein [Spiroplasma sp. AdecLV25b]
MLKTAILKKNPELNIENYQIINIAATNATITGKIPKYQGEVEVNFITEKRINLKTISHLTLPAPISITKNEKYFALNEKVIKASEFSNKPLALGYQIQYFDSINNEITNHNQRAGEFYVVITANEGDQVWKDKTQKIKLNLNFKLINEINGQINKIVFDNNENIYLAGSDGNIYRCLANESNFTIMPGTIDGRNRGKNGHQIYSLTTDSKGNIYAGSGWGDIYKRKVSENEFKIIRYGNGGGAVTALTIDESTNDIIFAKLHYIAKIPNNDTVNAPISQQSGPLPGGNTMIIGLKANKKGNIYAAVTWPVWEHGIWDYTYLGHQSEVLKITFSKHFNTTTKQIYNINYHSIGSLDSDTKLKDFIIDENDNFYVSTENGSVYHYDKENSEFKLLTIVDGQAITMAHTQNNNIYIATTKPLIPVINGYIYKYFINEKKAIEINWPHETITSIVTDKSGNLYITTDNGKIYLT